MKNNTSDSKYTKNHDLKRKARQKLLKFYLDDDRESKVFEILNESGNAKALVIEAVLELEKTRYVTKK